MRIFNAFLVIVAATLLWALPLTEVVYDFRTDLHEDSFSVSTAVGVTSANVTLSHFIYAADNSTLGFASSISEAPGLSAYTAATKTVLVASLTANATRTLEVTYEADALPGLSSLDKLLDVVPMFWIVMIIAFPVAALLAIFLGRA